MRVVFYSTSAEDLHRFRLPAARHLAEAGYDILFVGPDGPQADALKSSSFPFIPFGDTKSRLSPLGDVLMGYRLADLYHEKTPDIVHHFGMDAVVHGGIAAHKAQLPWVVHSVPGLGLDSARPYWLRPGARMILRRAMRDAEVTVQSAEDRHTLIAKGCTRPEFVHLIGDEVVDPEKISFVAEPAHDPVAALIGPFERPDEIELFIQAARRVRSSHPSTHPVRLRFAVIAPPFDLDDETRRRLEKWQEDGSVEWWPRSDVALALQKAHVVVAHSCRSYSTRSMLLAASATGRPIVGVNLHWCRAIIRDGSTGLLVPPDDLAALASVLSDLLLDRDKRLELGRQARMFIEQEYAAGHIARQIMGVYERLFERGREI